MKTQKFKKYLSMGSYWIALDCFEEFTQLILVN